MFSFKFQYIIYSPYFRTTSIVIAKCVPNLYKAFFLYKMELLTVYGKENYIKARKIRQNDRIIYEKCHSTLSYSISINENLYYKNDIIKKHYALFAYKTNKYQNLFYRNSENYLNFLFYKFSLQ